VPVAGTPSPRQPAAAGARARAIGLAQARRSRSDATARPGCQWARTGWAAASAAGLNLNHDVGTVTVA
jgi:hypothetical protein